MMLALATSLIAFFLLTAAGYLYGVRAGLQERDRLRADVALLRGEAQDASVESESEGDGLPSTIQEMLAPLVERERISRDLAKFNIGQGEKRDLTRLLDRVSSVGHFDTVLLSNEEGFPLASNGGAGNTERLAASLARLALVIDQTVANEGNAPLSFLLRDAGDAMTLCRIFHVRGQRLFFTAQSKDLRLTAADLDSAVSKVEAALTVTAALNG